MVRSVRCGLQPMRVTHFSFTLLYVIAYQDNTPVRVKKCTSLHGNIVITLLDTMLINAHN